MGKCRFVKDGAELGQGVPLSVNAGKEAVRLKYGDNLYVRQQQPAGSHLASRLSEDPIVQLG